MNKKLLTIAGLSTVIAAATLPAQAAPSFDFNDGTLQGWTPATSPFFGGNLWTSNTGGNPGGYIYVTDNDPTTGGMWVKAPISGDFSSYAGIQWDDFAFNNGALRLGTSQVIIQGNNGTTLTSAFTQTPLQTWTTHSLSFDNPSQWTISGSGTLQNVLANVSGLFINLDASFASTSGGVGVRESGLDNVKLIPRKSSIPEPSSLLGLLAFGYVATTTILKKK